MSSLMNRASGMPSHVHAHKEVLEECMCAIIADFKGTLDQIAKIGRAHV